MIDLLFGWITKPQIEWNVIDNIMCYTELALLFIIAVCLYEYIHDKKNKYAQ